MNFYHDADNVSGACGVAVLYRFCDTTEYWGRGQRTPFDPEVDVGGIGLTCAGFINTPECRRAFIAIKQHMQVVYMSPLRMNTNSDNEFFFAVFDRCEGKPKNRGYPWPKFTQSTDEVAF